MSARAADQAISEWQKWRENRAAWASAAAGPLALTGTHWLKDLDNGVAPGLPGRWLAEHEGVVHEVDGTRTALETEGSAVLLADGRTVRVILREGQLAVRVWDPASAARTSFAGIDVFDFDERWVVVGAFRPYDSIRSVLVANHDGRERSLPLGGELTFTAAGVEHTLCVVVEDDGQLVAILADGTSGRSTFRFRFLFTPAPGADGSVTVDLNRTQLPPCVFADAFVCPFPPPGNTLPYPLTAGERSVLTK